MAGGRGFLPTRQTCGRNINETVVVLFSFLKIAEVKQLHRLRVKG